MLIFSRNLYGCPHGCPTLCSTILSQSKWIERNQQDEQGKSLVDTVLEETGAPVRAPAVRY